MGKKDEERKRMREQMELGAEYMSDVVLLLGQMKQMNLPDLLDHRMSRE